MIKLSEEDLKFKNSAEYPGSENLVLAAIALETTEYVRTKYGQNPTYNQQSIIDMLMSILGWNEEPKTSRVAQIDWRNDRVKMLRFEQRLTNMISAYIFGRIIMLDREQKRSSIEIAEWLRKMAVFE